MQVDIFAHDLLLVPVHRGMHWCMAIINVKEKVIRYYDSMNGRYPQCADVSLVPVSRLYVLKTQSTTNMTEVIFLISLNYLL